ncbi:MAG TPA: hypothetical protein VE978_01380 [Chitinophagales bacterium]|nr:hypothetical protein [Chitinophagales bacterium]
MKTNIKNPSENLPEQLQASHKMNIVNSNTAPGCQAPVVVSEEPHPAHK